MKTYKSKANFFQILSHPVRLQILDELRKRQACVCHLQAVTGRPQAYVSQQLRILRDADLVVDEKVGQNKYYRLTSRLTSDLLTETLGQPDTPSHAEGCTCPYCTE